MLWGRGGGSDGQDPDTCAPLCFQACRTASPAAPRGMTASWPSPLLASPLMAGPPLTPKQLPARSPLALSSSPGSGYLGGWGAARRAPCPQWTAAPSRKRKMRFSITEVRLSGPSSCSHRDLDWPQPRHDLTAGKGSALLCRYVWLGSDNPRGLLGLSWVRWMPLSSAMSRGMVPRHPWMGLLLARTPALLP